MLRSKPSKSIIKAFNKGNIEVRKRKYIKMSYAGDDKVLIGVYVK
jgi:hypothetical protein